MRKINCGKEVLILIWVIVTLFGCSIDNEITQYIAVKDGEIWKCSHRIVYKVYADKQEVVYWIETLNPYLFPAGEGRSRLYKMKNCIIADSSNWEGEMDYHSNGPSHLLGLPMKVEVVSGKFKFDGIALSKVGWWKWNLDKTGFQHPYLSGWKSSDIITTTWCVWHNGWVWGFTILSLLLYGWHCYNEYNKEEKQKRKEAEAERKKKWIAAENEE